MKITTAAEMRTIDRVTTEKFGVPSLTLMENAGTAVTRFILAKYPRMRRATIFCGKGNNGGDGFVVARKLGDEGRRVTLVLLCDPSELRGDAAEMFARMKLDPVVIEFEEALREEAVTQALRADVIVDALLGTGFRPPVRDLYAAAIRVMSAAKKPIIAVDIPSGADADATAPVSMNDDGPTVCRADHVVTFTAPRPAHAFGGLTRGETMVAPIGSPAEAIESKLNLHVTTPRDFASLLTDRDPEGHKGTYGHVLTIGGSFGKAGAAAMAGITALRSGTGLSTIATPRSVLPMVAGFSPEIMTEALVETDLGTIDPEAREQMSRLLEGKDVVALGPGIGRYPATVDFVRRFVKDCKLPLVIDADGLNAFEGSAEKLNGSKRPLVLTPHPGEMSRLTGRSIKEIQEDRFGIAREFAAGHDCVLVLKGHRTLVALPDGTLWVNVTGNPGMATGGAGDVLTGLIAGMMAQTKDIPMAVRAAVYLHGFAGDVAREKVGEASLIAGDLIAHLPEAFKRARQALAAKGFVFHG